MPTYPLFPFLENHRTEIIKIELPQILCIIDPLKLIPNNPNNILGNPVTLINISFLHNTHNSQDL